MKKMSLLTLTICSLFLVSACSHKSGGRQKHHKQHHASSCSNKSHKHGRHAPSAEKYLKHVGEAVKIGELQAPTFKHMSFGAQPSKADLKAAKEAGYKVIINLRNPSEINWDEEAYVKSLGLSYYNVPLLNQEKEIDAAAVLKLERIHKETHKQKQLVHCSSGNRAAAWMAAHLMVKHHLSAEDAIKVSKPLGLTKPEIEEKVKAFAATL